MIQRVAQMKWIEAKDEWHFLDEDGNLGQEFFDCPSIDGYFEELDKEHTSTYDIIIIKRKDSPCQNKTTM